MNTSTSADSYKSRLSLTEVPRTSRSLDNEVISRSVPPDCYLEDLEHPGVLPPPPYNDSRASTSSTIKRASSCRGVLTNDTVPMISECLSRPYPLQSSQSPPSSDHQHSGRLPGTFDSLLQVQDTGVTPSPRSNTPLVLFPRDRDTILEIDPSSSQSHTQRFQSCISRKIKESLGVRIGKLRQDILIPTISLILHNKINIQYYVFVYIAKNSIYTFSAL